MKPFLQLKCLGTSWCIVAGSREQLRQNLGLVVATFSQSTNPTLFQSVKDAERRALACVKMLKEMGEFNDMEQS